MGPRCSRRRTQRYGRVYVGMERVSLQLKEYHRAGSGLYLANLRLEIWSRLSARCAPRQ